MRDTDDRRQRQQLQAVPFRQPAKAFFARSGETDQNLATVGRVPRPHDQAGGFAARHECNHAVLLRLKPSGQLADGCPLAARKAFDVKHQLILLRLQTLRPRCFLAEPKETAQLISKLRQRLEVCLHERRKLAFGVTRAASACGVGHGRLYLLGAGQPLRRRVGFCLGCYLGFYLVFLYHAVM